MSVLSRLVRRGMRLVRRTPAPLSIQTRSYRDAPGWASTTVAETAVIARRVVAVEPWRACAELATRIQTVLQAAEIEHWAVQPLRTQVTMWAIPDADLSRAVAALSKELSGEGYYVASRRGTPRLIDEGVVPDLDGERTLQVNRYLIDERGTAHGAAETCQLLGWRESPRGSLVTANKAAVVHELDDRRPVATVGSPIWTGAVQPRPAALATPDASEIDFEVDAVYMWVDDSDPQWRERREQARLAAQARGEVVEAASLAASRYRDRGELRASLRSLEMYAPWIRQIYLVTDQQCPSWLDATSGRVKVVDHREFFTEPDALPCFNSRAIGSQLHRIPGLAEHYLIINDDVLFNQPVSPYDFFTPQGALKIVMSRTHLPRLPESLLTTLERSRTNSAGLILRDHGQRVSRLFAHVPLAQSRTIGEELMQLYPEQILQTMRHRFRSAEDYETNAWLHQHRALYTGRGVVANTPFAYFNSDAAASQERLAGGDAVTEALFLCINDTDGGPDSGGWVAGWLQQAYPLPASWERPDATVAANTP